jgi:SAM-dependent methyltransferase
LSGVGYLGLGKGFNDWMYRLRREVFNKTVSGLAIDMQSAKVLDIGSGTGFYIDCWEKLGAKSITGVDITEHAVLELKKKFPNRNFAQMDIGESGVTLAEKFDIVDSMDVLFHIVDDQRFDTAIHNIANLLKPGGLFIFSDNFLRAGTVRGEHQVSRSLAEIETALHAAGFRIESRRPFFVLMNAPVDSQNVFLKKNWDRAMRQVKRNELTSRLGGMLFYQLDRILVSLLAESPTTEIMVCKKI